MTFRTAAVRRNVADNLRREHAIPHAISDDDILSLREELAFMDADEMHGYLREEHARLGCWSQVVARNLSLEYA
ncbi:hypothetical protein V1279_003012 [Bradyrhizobium sp. AZCC 1610]|uniref:hypothetical protein n=1 Tax=Bradyrhizobium sp. AZCC 1610 TaxID=3117020 RepID=UPI002FEF2F67